MADGPLDVVGIGNAIVDILNHADDGFLARNGLAKGVMSLIDEARAAALYAAMGPAIEASGGSAGNTVAGLAGLGSRAAYIGRVRDDELGRIFRHDIQSLGVEFDIPPATEGPATGRCFIFVTPDAQRTMQTYLGAAVELGPEDVDPALIGRAKVTYLEGYLFDRPRAKAAFLKAAEVAHQAGRRVALSLSDPFCVDRHRADFRDLVARHVDILFANEAEIMALYEVGDFDGALEQVRGHCEVAALTRSEKGSVILAGDAMHVIAAEPVPRVVDTTGAGDLYAAGFLHGYTLGYGLARSGRIASIAAGEVIGHLGPRPQTPLKELLRQRLA